MINKEFYLKNIAEDLALSSFSKKTPTSKVGDELLPLSS